MGAFKHGVIRKVNNQPYLEQPRFKMGLRSESYSFRELLIEFVMLRMLDRVAGRIFLDAANMFGKARTADRIIHKYCNGLGGLVSDFDNLVYHISKDYGLHYGDVYKASEQAVKIVEQAVLDAKKEAEKMLRIEEKAGEQI